MSSLKSRLGAPVVVALAMLAGAGLAAGTLSLHSALGADGSDWLSSAPATTVAAPPTGSPSLQEARALSGSFAEVVEKVSPAVVFIEVEKEPTGTPAGNFGPEGMPDMGPFRFFFGPGGPGMGEPGNGEGPEMPFGSPGVHGQGSGFIVTPDGYILTNNHVVGDMDRVRVTLADGRRFDAKVVGSDPQTEVALIKIEAKDLPIVKLADSDQLRVGEWVLAIGSPFGLSHSVTSGIVSARGRGDVGIVDYADFIQTDAAINPGNSGGPLLNLNGEVVGMNTAILSPSGSNAGIGFAIPVNMVKYVATQLRDHGSVTRGYFGINIQELTPDLARWFGLDTNQGVLVAGVTPDSPAADAGIQRDDVIVEMNGRPVGEVGAFRSHVSTTPAGQEVKLTVIRGGQRMEKTVKVGVLPNQDQGLKTTPAADKEGSSQGKLGVAVEPLNDQIASQLGYEGETGVVVTGVAPGSPAARAGLHPGSLIKEVNRQPVKSLEDLRKALKDGSKNDTALLLVREKEGSRYVAIDVAA